LKSVLNSVQFDRAHRLLDVLEKGINKWFKAIQDHPLLFIMGLAFFLRLSAFPYSDTVDSDAVSRVFMAQNWANNPEFIWHGTWLPFHQYFIGSFLLVFPSITITPIILNIVLATATVWAVYHFTALLFDKTNAWFPAILLAVSPIFFRNSLMAMAEIPGICTAAFGLLFVMRSIKRESLKDAVVAALFMTLSNGFRYESWVISGLLFIIFLLYRQYRVASIYAVIAVSFPVIWIVGNFIDDGNYMAGIAGANYFNLVLAGVNEGVGFPERMARLLFYPYSLTLSVGVWVMPLMLIALYRRGKTLSRAQWIWVLPFAFMAILVTYKAIDGTLLLQHRFSSTLLLLFLPFTVLIPRLFENSRLFPIILSCAALSILPFSNYMANQNVERWLSFSPDVESAFGLVRYIRQDQAEPIPKLKEDRPKELVKLIRSRCENCALVLDFTGWQETYYVALNVGLDPGQIMILPGTKYEEINWLRIEQFLNKNQAYPGLILLKDESRFHQSIKESGAVKDLMLIGPANDSLDELSIRTFKNLQI
jgi:hypothetical protein